jgi:fructose PTS system EIIBC or EIIC component
MAKLIAVTFCPTGIAHSMMAAEALKKTAALLGHDIQVEVHGAMGTTNPLLDETIAAADAVLIAADLLALVPGLVQAPAQPTAPVAPGPAAGPTPTAVGRRIVAITACPTGIATPSWPRMR